MAEKSQLSMIAMAAIMLLAIGVVVAVSANVLDDIRGQTVSGVTITNQSFTLANNTDQSISGGEITSITSVSNLTLLLNVSDFTLTAGESGSSVLSDVSCGGTGEACEDIDGDVLNITYQVLQKTAGSLAAGNATQALGSFQLANVGTTVGAIIIIGIIMLAIVIVGGSRITGRREE